MNMVKIFFSMVFFGVGLYSYDVFYGALEQNATDVTYTKRGSYTGVYTSSDLVNKILTGDSANTTTYHYVYDNNGLIEKIVQYDGDSNTTSDFATFKKDENGKYESINGLMVEYYNKFYCDINFVYNDSGALSEEIVEYKSVDDNTTKKIIVLKHEGDDITAMIDKQDMGYPNMFVHEYKFHKNISCKTEPCLLELFAKEKINNALGLLAGLKARTQSVNFLYQLKSSTGTPEQWDYERINSGSDDNTTWNLKYTFQNDSLSDVKIYKNDSNSYVQENKVIYDENGSFSKYAFYDENGTLTEVRYKLDHAYESGKKTSTSLEIDGDAFFTATYKDGRVDGYEISDLIKNANDSQLSNYADKLVSFYRFIASNNIQGIDELKKFLSLSPDFLAYLKENSIDIGKEGIAVHSFIDYYVSKEEQIVYSFYDGMKVYVEHMPSGAFRVMASHCAYNFFQNDPILKTCLGDKTQYSVEQTKNDKVSFIKSLHYDENETLDHVTTSLFSYNANGLLQDSLVDSIETYHTYNSNGKIVKQTNSQLVTIYKYNDSGKKEYEKIVDFINGTIQEVYLTYDDNGRIEKEDTNVSFTPTYSGGDVAHSEKRTYSYESNGVIHIDVDADFNGTAKSWKELIMDLHLEDGRTAKTKIKLTDSGIIDQMYALDGKIYDASNRLSASGTVVFDIPANCRDDDYDINCTVEEAGIKDRNNTIVVLSSFGYVGDTDLLSWEESIFLNTRYRTEYIYDDNNEKVLKRVHRIIDGDNNTDKLSAIDYYYYNKVNLPKDYNGNKIVIDTDGAISFLRDGEYVKVDIDEYVAKKTTENNDNTADTNTSEDDNATDANGNGNEENNDTGVTDTQAGEDNNATDANGNGNEENNDTGVTDTQAGEDNNATDANGNGDGTTDLEDNNETVIEIETTDNTDANTSNQPTVYDKDIDGVKIHSEITDEKHLVYSITDDTNASTNVEISIPGAKLQISNDYKATITLPMITASSIVIDKQGNVSVKIQGVVLPKEKLPKGTKVQVGESTIKLTIPMPERLVF